MTDVMALSLSLLYHQSQLTILLECEFELDDPATGVRASKSGIRKSVSTSVASAVEFESEEFNSSSSGMAFELPCDWLISNSILVDDAAICKTANRSNIYCRFEEIMIIAGVWYFFVGPKANTIEIVAFYND